MRHPLLSLGAPLLACLAACEPSATAVEYPPAIVFLALNASQDAYMEALFQGRVTLDAQGCLRLDAGDRDTVIWPHGYTLDTRGGALVVKDAQGRDVGTVGGSFRLGGGEVSSLDQVSRLSAETRAQAEESCPGRYWFASPEM
ncbi:MAG: hypothetical protein ACJ8GN_13320 [Longimicrobiaceae bacterium]